MRHLRRTSSDSLVSHLNIISATAVATSSLHLQACNSYIYQNFLVDGEHMDNSGVWGCGSPTGEDFCLFTFSSFIEK